MGTSVLHPQDCLAAPQSDRHRRFSCVSECASSVARAGGRATSATYEASFPATECGRDVALSNRILNQGRSFLGRKNASAGLLPLPNQASQSAHSSFRRLAPKISPCRSGKTAGPHSSKHLTSSHHSNFLSSFASDMSISKCPSMPLLDHAARSRRFFSESLPWHAVQLHERRQFFLNSAQGYCMTDSSPCAAEAALPCQKLKFLANSRFSDAFNPIHRKWVDCTDQSVHPRKRMHPELSQVEVYLGRQCAKPLLKVLPDGQGETICTNTNTVGRNHGVNRQLKRSASEKRQDKLKVPTLQRPGTNEAAKKHTTSVGFHTAKCHSSKIEVGLTSSAPPASSLEGKIVKGLQRQASLDSDTQGRMCVFKMGTARSSQVTLSQQMGGTERNVGAFLHGQCYGSLNAAMDQNEVNKADQITGIAGCVSKEYDLLKGDVTGTFDNQLAVRKPDTLMGFEGISRSPNSVLDNDEMWVSVMNDERWAGPSFFNSPSPSSLPVPSFTLKFSRTASTVSVPIKTTDYGAHMVSDNSLLEAKCMLDAAFATKDLRRMLNLDHGSSCDV